MNVEQLHQQLSTSDPPGGRYFRGNITLSKFAMIFDHGDKVKVILVYV